ncbi:carbohydrate ABC transporter permease [Nakamurella endophytica]|uniref:Sugar ABC transporter permease n=1 Tax=Nakamurella endophytica TaxID=1748367 RepID=A0A917WEV1_9ACTN|nr:sugar ABC transporter permease [Nakamurella endophytica]GGL98211.1 sugar ABC transporter permease [Nakamurella endophytica]
MTLTQQARTARAAGATGGRPPRGGTGMRRRQTLWAYAFLSPALVLFAVTVIYPMIRAFQYSLYRWPLGSAPKVFVGLQNYRQLITDDQTFHRSVWNTLYFTVVSVVPTVALALAVALLLNRPRLRARGVFRTIYFVPVVTSLVAVGYVWKALLEPTFGIVNTVLGWFGIPGPGWLGDPGWALNGIVLMSIWRDVGFYMVILLAGLQAIPREILEAATMDGAGPWQRFRRITLPLLNPSILLATVIGVIAGLQLFTQVYVMTGSAQQPAGGPLNSTRSAVLFIVQNAFGPLEMGYPSAAAFLLFILIMLVTLLQFRFVQRKFEY